jgi:hypothetical protein
MKVSGQPCRSICEFRVNVICFAYESVANMGRHARTAADSRAELASAPHLHWFGPTANDIDRKLIARQRRVRIYASANAGSTLA